MSNTAYQDGYAQPYPNTAPADCAELQTEAEGDGEQNRWGQAQSAGNGLMGAQEASAAPETVSGRADGKEGEPMYQADPRYYQFGTPQAPQMQQEQPQEPEACNCGGHEAEAEQAAPQGPAAFPVNGFQYAPMQPQGPGVPVQQPPAGYQYAAPHPQGPNTAMMQGPNPAAQPKHDPSLGMVYGPQYAAPQGQPQYMRPQMTSAPVQPPASPYMNGYQMPYQPRPAAPAQGMYHAPQPPLQNQFQPQYAAPSAPHPGMPFYGYQPNTEAPYNDMPEQEHGCAGKKGGESHSHEAEMPGFGPAAFAAQGAAFDPKHLEYRYGQIMEICNDIMQGKTDPGKIAAFLSTSGTHFWKGAIVGAALTFLLTNNSVRSALGETFSGLFGGTKGE